MVVVHVVGLRGALTIITKSVEDERRHGRLRQVLAEAVQISSS